MSRGFTFLEIILVFGLISLLTVIGVVNLSRLQSIFKARSTADEVRSMLQLARQLTLNNSNQTTYQVSLSGDVITLTSTTGTEINRFQPSKGVVFSPSGFIWRFEPITGSVTGCVSPCQLDITFGSATQSVIINSSGIIN